jgi:hypothetical protein
LCFGILRARIVVVANAAAQSRNQQSIVGDAGSFYEHASTRRMEFFASSGIFDTIVISIDIETGLCQHCHNEFQVIGRQIATA